MKHRNHRSSRESGFYHSWDCSPGIHVILNTSQPLWQTGWGHVTGLRSVEFSWKGCVLCTVCAQESGTLKWPVPPSIALSLFVVVPSEDRCSRCIAKTWEQPRSWVNIQEEPWGRLTQPPTDCDVSEKCTFLLLYCIFRVYWLLQHWWALPWHS